MMRWGLQLAQSQEGYGPLRLEHGIPPHSPDTALASHFSPTGPLQIQKSLSPTGFIHPSIFMPFPCIHTPLRAHP